MNQLPNIDKIFREDEDMDFTPPVRSNLAAIFGTPQKVVPEPNSSLRYLSPKQPAGGRSTPQSQASTGKTEVITAKVVHAYKLQSGRYVSVGKLGLALTGNTGTRQYQIILYKGKQEHVSLVNISPGFKYTVQADKYSSYYDGNNDNWSILFDTDEAGTEFAREVGLSRYLSRQGKTESFLYQNLNTAEEAGPVAKEGDSVVIKFVTSLEMVQPVKLDGIAMETMSLEISKDDNWERLLIGTGKGLKRMMILPPNKQIGLGPGFPRDKDILLEIEVIGIDSPPEEPSPAAAKPSVSGGKAAIISRMAKMGKSMLPKQPASTTTDSEDTEDETFRKSPRHKRPEATGSSLQKKQSNRKPESQSETKLKPVDIVPSTITVPYRQPAFAPQRPQSHIQQQYMSIDGQLYPVQQQTIAQPIPAAMDPGLNVFLSETRTQNTEIRMGMSKIADNVQKLLDKFHVLEVQNASTPTADKTMEATLKMLLEANKNVEARSNETSEKRDSVPADSNLLAVNQELTDKVSLLENKLKMSNDFIFTKAEAIINIRQDNSKLEQSNTELKARIQELEESLIETRNKLEEASKSSQQTKELIESKSQENYKLEHRITELGEKCKELEYAALNAKPNAKSPPDQSSRDIKRIMNETYQTLLASFTEEAYKTDSIKATIATTIKDVTLKVLEEARDANDSSTSDKNESMEKSEAKTYKSNEAAVTLPDFTTNPTVSTAQDEPPPIPPMDYDVEGDWTS